MKLLVCGGRTFNDYEDLSLVLKSYLAPDLFIIHGGARGADSLAGRWASEEGIPCAIVPANWDYYKKRAGYIRNSWMLKLDIDEVLAFPGGRGTAGMCKLAEQQGIPVHYRGWLYEND